MTKIITPEAMLSYEHLFEAASPEGSSDEPKYSVCLVFSEDADLSDMKKAVVDTGKAKWGDKYAGMKKSGEIRIPFRNDKLEEKGYPSGSVYINARSKQPPGVVSKYAGEDGRPKRITDPTEIYSGCRVRATLSAFAYEHSGNRGISFGLNNVQKLGEGERLDGRLRAEEDFEAIENDASEIDDLLS